MKDSNKELTLLNRHQLGLISVKDLIDIDSKITGNDRKGYVALVASVWSLLESEIRNAICEQVDYMARHSENWEQVLMGRGGINFGEVILERFRKLNNEHLENVKKPEEFDPFQPV
jgi:hypothetical protein